MVCLTCQIMACTEAFGLLSSACSAYKSTHAAADVALLPKPVKECNCNYHGKTCLFARIDYFIWGTTSSTRRFLANLYLHIMCVHVCIEIHISLNPNPKNNHYLSLSC